jgi:hypothetical protein
MMAPIIFLTLVVAILFLTISGGGLFPITVGIVAMATSGLACLVTYRNPGTRPHLEISLALLLLFILITALPLPPALDALAGSLRHQQNQAVVTSVHEAAHVGAPPLMEEPWFCLSRNRAGTLRFFLLLAAAISACLLTAALPSKGKLVFLGFLALLGTGVGISGYIGQWKIPQGDTLWWFIPIPHAPTSPVGCFLNRNHFGGFVAMLCPVALALTAHSLSTRHWVGAIFYLGLTSLMGGVVFMSLSRGAMLAMAVGLVTTALIITFRHRLRWGVVLLCLMAAGGGLMVSQSPAIRERLEGIHNPAQLDSVNSRLNEWKESLRVWPHYPIMGAGANALRMVYPQYRQTSVGARLIHAENEYIQLVAECGLLGVGLALMVAWNLRQRLKQAAPPPPAVIITAVSGALSVTAIHCIFDFPAHLPLYALVLGALVGLLLTPTPEPHPRRWLATTPALIALLGTITIACYHPTDVRTMDDPNYLYKAKYRDLHRALIWAPTSAAWLYLGRTMFKEGTVVRNGPLCSQAEAFMTRAATLDPQNYRLWYEVGQIRLSLNDNQRATEAFQKAQALRSWMTPPVIPGGGATP